MTNKEMENRDYEALKDKYFIRFSLIEDSSHEQFVFDSIDEAKHYILKKMNRSTVNLDKEYARYEKEVSDAGGVLRILCVKDEVKNYEEEFDYGGDDGFFTDRQNFIDVVVFNDYGEDGPLIKNA